MQCSTKQAQRFVENESAHVLAVAEWDKKLEDFKMWYKKLKQSPTNVTALAEMDLPSSRGTKRSKSTQIRKGGKNTNKHPRQVIENYLKLGSEIPVMSTITGEATTSTPHVQTQLVLSFKFAQFDTDYVYRNESLT